MKLQDYTSIRNPTEIPDNAVYHSMSHLWRGEESNCLANENMEELFRVAKQKILICGSNERESDATDINAVISSGNVLNEGSFMTDLQIPIIWCQQA